jgi:hypothetical protein
MANKEQLLKYKGNRCAGCGLEVGEILRRYGDVLRIFEFHHIDPSKKHPDYDNLIRRVLSTEQLDEVDKCLLVCSNCHGIFHGQNLKATLSFLLRWQKKTYEQTVSGVLMIDKGTSTWSFFSDEEVLFLPYKVSQGGRRPRHYFGRELKPKLIPFLLETERFSPLVIRDHKDKVLLQARDMGNGNAEMVMDIRFHLMPTQLFVDVDQPGWWVRNGVAVGVEGEVISDGRFTIGFSYPKLAGTG